MEQQIVNEAGLLETDDVVVRRLTDDDLDGVVRIDEASIGRNRYEFYKRRIERSMAESSIHLSLAAELDGMLVGFLTVTFYQGEFGRPEATAVLDAIGVHPDFRGKAVAHALMRQLEMNLRALHVERLRTDVDWDQFELLSFMRRAGFQPMARLCLEKVLEPR
jgi:GNAT superfamily N-acetyltransferase